MTPDCWIVASSPRTVENAATSEKTTQRTLPGVIRRLAMNTGVRYMVQDAIED